MSSKEVQMWISSDEINVSAEEDLFKIILAWIDHDKSNREDAELFRQVRLAYVSRDFLSSDIVTNDFVKDNEGCLDLVTAAMNLIESKNYCNLFPRKSLARPVMVTFSSFTGQDIRCYFPREDRWESLGKMPFYFGDSYLASCPGKIYGIQIASPFHPESWHTMQSCGCRMVSNNPYLDKWMSLPFKEERDLKQIFVGNEDEMYVLVSKPCADCYRCHRLSKRGVLNSYLHERQILVCIGEKHVSYITKYTPESNSWEDITSFDHLTRAGILIPESECHATQKFKNLQNEEPC